MKRIVAVSALLVLSTAAALADVLVTQAGERIETQGPWNVKGRTVVFTSKAGVLSSVRLSEIDLEASEAATEEAKKPKPVPPPPMEEKDRLRLPIPPVREPGKAVMTITNKDVGPARGAPVSATAFGIDLSGLDEQGRKRAMDELFTLGKQLARVHQQYDLQDPEGVRRAAGELQGIARQLRARVKRARPEEQKVLESIALGMENIAAQARTSPEAVASLFYEMPPREQLTDEAMQALDSAAAREAFEEEAKRGGGGRS